MTWALKSGYPGRFLSAEITPEDPALMQEYGFDAIWVHSGQQGARSRTRSSVHARMHACIHGLRAAALG